MKVELTEYRTLQFVYPYTLEDFVLHPQPPHKSHHDRIAKLHSEHETRLKFLQEREEEKTRKRKEALRKVAPGYEPPEDDDGVTEVGSSITSDLEEKHKKTGILEPTRKSQVPLTDTLSTSPGQTTTSAQAEDKPRDVMDDLVEGLARMDELENKSETK